MATRQGDDGGSRLWRGIQHLIFGDDAEPTLRDQIEEAIDEAEESHGHAAAGDLSSSERQMFRNLLNFGDQTAGDICVTRGDIFAVRSNVSFDELVRAFADAGHSRLPVYGESLDEVIGMIHMKDVFMASVDPERDRSIESLMREPLFVPESMGVIDLLTQMRVGHVHLAIVVDEYGGTAGLVSVEDLLEEIVGEIRDEYDVESETVTEESPGTFVFSGKVSVDEVRDRLGIEIEREGFETVVVFLLSHLGRMPYVGETFDVDGLSVEVLEVERRRITKVRVRRREPLPAEAPS
jgi:CBS domain containing-hemolysin-like protein